jgi:hypothetical protein
VGGRVVNGSAATHNGINRLFMVQDNAKEPAPAEELTLDAGNVAGGMPAARH